MSILVVFLHSFLHALADDLPRVILVDVDGDGHSDQGQEDQGQHGGEGVHHAVVVGASSAASEEGHDHHDSAQDDQDDRSVEVGVAQEVQVLGHVDLDVGSDADQGRARQEEDEVEEENEVFDDYVAAPHFESFSWCFCNEREL